MSKKKGPRQIKRDKRARQRRQGKVAARHDAIRGKGPVTLVTGQGRCGSSMVMRMLRAGGMEWTFPLSPGEDFLVDGTEDDRTMALSSSAQMDSLLDELEGSGGLKVAKVLNPPTRPAKMPRDRRYRWIWMIRHPLEQARSSFKVLCALGQVPPEVWLTRNRTIMDLHEQIRIERRNLDKWLLALPVSDLIVLDYGLVLKDPYKAAEQLAEFVTPHAPPDFAFDLAAAASVVHERDEVCLPIIAECDIFPGFDQGSFDQSMLRLTMRVECVEPIKEVPGG